MYTPDKFNKTVTNVNKLFASTDVESAIHCALKCQEFNCTSFTYGKKLGFSDCYNATSRDYIGRQATTNSGTICQRWDAKTPHDHKRVHGFPDHPFHNFCRDPDFSGTPWCFTVNADIRWEACPVKECTFKFTHDGCYDDDLLSMNYTGSTNLTRSGKDCQRWDSQIPHGHNLTDENFPEATLSDVKNYCRDPTASGYTWCYTTDPETRWEHCDVSSCTKYRNDNLCYNDIDHKRHYKGRWDITMANIQCQRWDSPNYWELTSDMFPDGSLKKANNYCRYLTGNGPSYHVTCYDGPSVRSYMGTWNKTVSGKPCQRWDVHTPHSHNLTADMFEEDRLKDAENFCRDPTNSGKLWCYTTDPNIEKERCGIGKCSGGKYV
ncbi:hypothetical protein ACF0H5_023051 [Mactra antiquata]